jgi:hypothetical protein
MSDGWNLLERSEFEMTMAHVVEPPGWRIGLELVNPLAWLAGGPTWTEVTRVLHVRVDEQGTLHRTTTGDVPNKWRRPRTWELPDGPETEQAS